MSVTPHALAQPTPHVLTQPNTHTDTDKYMHPHPHAEPLRPHPGARVAQDEHHGEAWLMHTMMMMCERRTWATDSETGIWAGAEDKQRRRAHRNSQEQDSQDKAKEKRVGSRVPAQGWARRTETRGQQKGETGRQQRASTARKRMRQPILFPPPCCPGVHLSGEI